MKYTKAERHEIYKQAYIVFTNEWKKNVNLHFICNCIRSISCVYYNDWSVMEFPELLDKKPFDKTVYQAWWPEWDFNTRNNVFEQIIEETKE
jgi:hypothetical protein